MLFYYSVSFTTSIKSEESRQILFLTGAELSLLGQQTIFQTAVWSLSILQFSIHVYYG